MQNRLLKYSLIGCNIILLVSIFFSLGGFSFLEEKFCLLGIYCNEGNSSIEDDLDCSIYEYNEEGKVSNKGLHNKSFFETVEKVINVSLEEHNKIIQEISGEGSFKEIYNKYICIFNQNYSLKIDSCLNADYVQNIGELISNNYHGDCDDYALWLYLIAKEKGLEVRYVIGYRDSIGHAWIQIKIDDEWIDYDSTINQQGKNVVSKKYQRIYYYG